MTVNIIARRLPQLQDIQSRIRRVKVEEAYLTIGCEIKDLEKGGIRLKVFSS